MVSAFYTSHISHVLIFCLLVTEDEFDFENPANVMKTIHTSHNRNATFSSVNTTNTNQPNSDLYSQTSFNNANFFTSSQSYMSRASTSPSLDQISDDGDDKRRWLRPVISSITKKSIGPDLSERSPRHLTVDPLDNKSFIELHSSGNRSPRHLHLDSESHSAQMPETSSDYQASDRNLRLHTDTRAPTSVTSSAPHFRNTKTQRTLLATSSGLQFPSKTSSDKYLISSYLRSPQKSPRSTVYHALLFLSPLSPILFPSSFSSSFSPLPFPLFLFPSSFSPLPFPLFLFPSSSLNHITHRIYSLHLRRKWERMYTISISISPSLI
jgi:hypothetical protein